MIENTFTWLCYLLDDDYGNTIIIETVGFKFHACFGLIASFAFFSLLSHLACFVIPQRMENWEEKEMI